MANFPKHRPFILDIWAVSNYRRVEAIEPALHLLEEIADSSPPSVGQLDQEGRGGADSHHNTTIALDESWPIVRLRNDLRRICV